MSDNQTATDAPNPNISYASHVEARTTGFVRADHYPLSSNHRGRASLVESQKAYARLHGVTFDGDSR